MAAFKARHVRPDVHKLVFGAGRPPHVVIIGAGFAGMEAARVLAPTGADVTLIDRRNYHLFQPLLYQVATASLSSADIAVSIRSVFRDYKNVDMLYDEVLAIDLKNRYIHTRDNAAQHYDYLIVVTGANYNYYGHEEWRRHAPALKTLEDAEMMRGRILSAFERAETTDDSVLQKELLTFVLIGGGATGVEMAGAISELVREGLVDYRHIDPRLVDIVLIEAGPSLLSGFSPKARRYAHRALERRGVKIFLNSPVQNISDAGVLVNGAFIPAATVIWCAGAKASPAGKWLKAKCAANGSVIVEKDLSLPGYPEVFVAGDAAAVQGHKGYLPGLAAVAKQQGAYLGRLIAARMNRQNRHEPFYYEDRGMMVAIGRGAAAADFETLKLTGLMAWILWGAVHIYYLIGFRNRLIVLMSWAWTMMRLGRRNWLITGPKEEGQAEEVLRIPAPEDRRIESDARGAV